MALRESSRSSSHRDMLRYMYRLEDDFLEADAACRGVVSVPHFRDIVVRNGASEQQARALERQFTVGAKRNTATTAIDYRALVKHLRDGSSRRSGTSSCPGRTPSPSLSPLSSSVGGRSAASSSSWAVGNGESPPHRTARSLSYQSPVSEDSCSAEQRHHHQSAMDVASSSSIQQNARVRFTLPRTLGTPYEYVAASSSRSPPMSQSTTSTASTTHQQRRRASAPADAFIAQVVQTAKSISSERRSRSATTSSLVSRSSTSVSASRSSVSPLGATTMNYAMLMDKSSLSSPSVSPPTPGRSSGRQGNTTRERGPARMSASMSIMNTLDLASPPDVKRAHNCVDQPTSAAAAPSETASFGSFLEHHTSADTSASSSLSLRDIFSVIDARGMGTVSVSQVYASFIERQLPVSLLELDAVADSLIIEAHATDSTHRRLAVTDFCLLVSRLRPTLIGRIRRSALWVERTNSNEHREVETGGSSSHGATYLEDVMVSPITPTATGGYGHNHHVGLTLSFSPPPSVPMPKTHRGSHQKQQQQQTFFPESCDDSEAVGRRSVLLTNPPPLQMQREQHSRSVERGRSSASSERDGNSGARRYGRSEGKSLSPHASSPFVSSPPSPSPTTTTSRNNKAQHNECPPQSGSGGRRVESAVVVGSRLLQSTAASRGRMSNPKTTTATASTSEAPSHPIMHDRRVLAERSANVPSAARADGQHDAFSHQSGGAKGTHMQTATMRRKTSSSSSMNNTTAQQQRMAADEQPLRQMHPINTGGRPPLVSAAAPMVSVPIQSGAVIDCYGDDTADHFYASTPGCGDADGKLPDTAAEKLIGKCSNLLHACTRLDVSRSGYLRSEQLSQALQSVCASLTAEEVMGVVRAATRADGQCHYVQLVGDLVVRETYKRDSPLPKHNKPDEDDDDKEDDKASQSSRSSSTSTPSSSVSSPSTLSGSSPRPRVPAHAQQSQDIKELSQRAQEGREKLKHLLQAEFRQLVGDCGDSNNNNCGDVLLEYFFAKDDAHTGYLEERELRDVLRAIIQKFSSAKQQQQRRTSTMTTPSEWLVEQCVCLTRLPFEREVVTLATGGGNGSSPSSSALSAGSDAERRARDRVHRIPCVLWQALCDYRYLFEELGL